MSVLKHLALVLACSACVSAILGPSNATKPSVQKTDTYLDAYSKSRIEAEKAKQGVVIVTAKDGEKKISNRDDSYNSGYDYTPPFSSDSSFSGPTASSNYSPSQNYGSPTVKFESDITYNSPPNTYGPPSPNYGPPVNTYGPPANTYGPPANTYGPPANNYGPPSPPVHNYGPPAPAYGPPAPAYGPPLKPLAPVYGPPPRPNYGVPYTAPALSFFDKLSLKLDILTVAKLLLKFFIFKKIVTMLAVVCMLLVIPKLISFKKEAPGGGATDEDERRFGSSKAVELTSLQQFLERAIAVYGRQEPGCGVGCRVRRVIDDIYQFQPYFRDNASQSP